jgi:cytochrome c peroxidase
MHAARTYRVRFAYVALTICAALCAQIAPTAAHADNRSQRYEWRLPPGFPQPAVPRDNPMSASKVELGCRLFFDTRLSINNTQSCATCHKPELAFTDAQRHPHGATGEALKRNAATLTNVAYNPAFTWASSDKRTLERQMETPLFATHPVEMGLDKAALKRHDMALLNALRRDPVYESSFRTAFPNERTPLTMRNIIKSIAAFQRTLISGRSPYDRFMSGDQSAMSSAAKRGMALFNSRAGCSHCHSGVNFSGEIARANAKPPKPTFANTGLYNMDGKGSYPDMDIGLKEETDKERDMGRFRVPTLRNVALTRPYMHNGILETLDEVIEHYAAGGRMSGARDPKINKQNRYRDARIQPLDLSEQDKSDLVTFLISLTDLEFVQQDFSRCRTDNRSLHVKAALHPTRRE